MNNKQNNLIRCALEKIKKDEKHRPNCCVIIGPTHTVKSVN